MAEKLPQQDNSSISYTVLEFSLNLNKLELKISCVFQKISFTSN